MNTLDLGNHWLMKLSHALPHGSSRIRTRLAWRLAALSVQSDEAFRNLDDAELVRFVGGSPKMAEMRLQYIEYLDGGTIARTREAREPGSSATNRVSIATAFR
jgi:hypothetical protein